MNQTTSHYTLPMVEDGRSLSHIKDDRLIRRFQIKNKNKVRDVNDPIPELKSILKDWNGVITDYYVDELEKHGVTNVAHAYLPNKSIQTNAAAHTSSSIIQFDFKGFYDSCQFEYFSNHLKNIDPSINKQNEYLIKRLLIDPHTGGVTQGLPVSGALAGLSLIPFWVELKKVLPSTIRFTQYSDDLTFSHTSGGRTPSEFTIETLKNTIETVLKKTNLAFQLNTEKTRMQKEQFRKVTGIRINHHNQMTPSRSDYRFLRHALHVLSRSNDLDKELKTWGFSSKAAFVGKVSYMRSIDHTEKINKLIMKHRLTCEKHGLFSTWIKDANKYSAFA